MLNRTFIDSFVATKFPLLMYDDIKVNLDLIDLRAKDLSQNKANICFQAYLKKISHSLNSKSSEIYFECGLYTVNYYKKYFLEAIPDNTILTLGEIYNCILTNKVLLYNIFPDTLHPDFTVINLTNNIIEINLINLFTNINEFTKGLLSGIATLADIDIIIFQSNGIDQNNYLSYTISV